MTSANDANMFLGLDSSTQGLKATVISSSLDVVATASVNYDADLPEFETSGGVHRHADGLTVTSPTLMWVAALDLLLDRMASDGVEFGRIAGISGSGQQHGSVWLKSEALAALRTLDPGRGLREQLDGIFSVADSPIWMDASTGAQCAALEESLGGAQAVADLTGSRAYERFTGNQIAKIYQSNQEAYAATDRIGLVSSFMASLLIGDHAPIDTADGSGMNLMDIRTRDWASRAMECTAPDLAARLGNIVAGHTDVGSVHNYYVARYGFSDSCRVFAFSGDNPNSLAGLRLRAAGDVAISLGTSDTVFGILTEPSPSATEGHIFANPVDPDSYMAMIVYVNGSLTREAVRDRCADGTWSRYNELLASTPPGNNGQVGFFIEAPEITPPILETGVRLFDSSGERVASLDPAAEVRAAYEGQFLSMRLHGGHVGLKRERIFATGGASVDRGLVQIMSDVMGVAVYRAESSDSASLGAAYRALHGWRCREAGEFVPFKVALAGAPELEPAVRPDTAADQAYTALLPHYAACEQKVIG